MDDLTSLSVFLSRIGGLNPSMLIEVRYSVATGMSQIFIPGNEMHEATRTIRRLARAHDVYVGAAPRRERAGGKRAVKGLPMVWVDCDSPEATERLRDFTAEWAAPTFVVQSGTPGHVHAWWLLKNHASPRAAEIANRRIAHAVGADPRVYDRARVMRPPATLNHKTDPPLPVKLVEYRPRTRYALAELVEHLPDPPDAAPTPRSEDEPRERKHSDDPLLDLPATEYVPALTGEYPNRVSKVSCPFHNESGPSLHLYHDPEKGWHCFGCGRGGSIYDFAGRLWELPTRGDGFKAIRRRLKRELADLL